MADTPTPAAAVLTPATVRSDSGRFLPGRSGNPTGRPQGERKLLARMFGRDGRKVFKRLEELRNDPDTPRRLKAQIDMFLIERQFGKAAQLLGVESGPSLVALLAEVTARTRPLPPAAALETNGLGLDTNGGS